MATKYVSAEKGVTKTSKAQHELVTDLIDKLVSLAGTYNKAKKMVAEYDKMKSALKDHIPEAASATAPVTFIGDKGNVEFSPQSVQRTLTDVHAFHKQVGDEVFYAIATVPLKEVDRYLTEDEQEGLVEKSATGARKFKILPKE